MTGWRLVGSRAQPTSWTASRWSTSARRRTSDLPDARRRQSALPGRRSPRNERRFRRTKGVMHQGLSSLPGFVVPEPEGAFYILCDITGTGLTDIEFAHQALEHAQVQVIPGSLMKGGDGLIRIVTPRPSPTSTRACVAFASGLNHADAGTSLNRTWMVPYCSPDLVSSQVFLLRHGAHQFTVRREQGERRPLNE